jgi:hypothetical protein
MATKVNSSSLNFVPTEEQIKSFSSDLQNFYFEIKKKIIYTNDLFDTNIPSLQELGIDFSKNKKLSFQEMCKIWEDQINTHLSMKRSVKLEFTG